MAKKMNIKWNHEGFEAILCSSGVMGKVQEQAERICARANANNTRGGDGFGQVTRLGHAYGSRRALGFVYTIDRESRIAESEDKALSKAVSG